MNPKTTFMRFLFIEVISVFFFAECCGKEIIGYRMTIELVFVNQTDRLISFELLKYKLK